MNRWLWLSLAMTGAAFAGALYAYEFRFDDLPASVPTHWNIHDEPDAWVPRDRILPIFLLLPGTMVGLLALMVAIPHISPKQFEVEPFQATYWYTMAMAVAVLAYLQAVVLIASFDRGVSVGRLIVAGLSLFFVLLGNVLGKVRRNFWIGIRTPWTLASDRVWTDTHRLAAWLMVAGGVLGFVAVLAGAPMLLCILVVIGGPVVVPAAYSLLLYKRLERRGQL
jgi:uncharacterized membrane protein